jgi:hypothetical protein
MNADKCNNLVEIVGIHTIDSPDIGTIYLLKISGIEIRFYITIDEARNDYEFMKKVVNNIIDLGSEAKVEIEEVKTNRGIYYLLKIANKNIKVYTHKNECERIAGYMTTVVDTILKTC